MRKRWLPSAIIEAASAAGVLREGPAGSAWFAHLDGHGVVAHVDVRGPTYKGSLTGGAKSLFRLPPKGPLLPARLVLAEAAIDAVLSVAAIESLRKDTLYAATGGGIGPGTTAAEALLASIAMLPAASCSAADANGPGDRFADHHRSLAEKFRIPFARLRPPNEGGDWNDVLSQPRFRIIVIMEHISIKVTKTQDAEGWQPILHRPAQGGASCSEDEFGVPS